MENGSFLTQLIIPRHKVSKVFLQIAAIYRGDNNQINDKLRLCKMKLTQARFLKG